MLVFVVVCTSGRRIGIIVCENRLACFLKLYWGFYLGLVLCCLLGFLGISRKFLYRNIRVVGFAGFLFFLGLAHLGRAMGIVLFRKCIWAYVMVGDGMWVL